MKFLEFIKKKFRVVIVDSEFQLDKSLTYPKEVLCFVYKDISTGEIFRVWEKDQLHSANNIFDFETTLFVCFYATAEAGCFMKQYYGRPPFVFDCWTEYAKLYKNQRPLSMLAAAAAYQVKNLMSVEDKEANLNLIIKQDTWTKDEQLRILDYCQRDVEQTEEVFYGVLKDLEKKCGDDYEILLDQAIARGQAMACVQKTQLNGIPVDNKLIEEFNEYWPDVKNSVIQRVNKKLNLWDEDSKFSNEKFEKLVRRIGLFDDWPRTPKGKLQIRSETLELFADTFDEIKEVKRIFNLLSSAKLAEYIISEDGRLRPYSGFKMFGTHTGRCAPSSKWIFGTAKWGRNFMKPSYRSALVYLDYRSEEPFVAARLSGDKKLMDAYNTGDVYLATAKLAGLADDNATKETHGEVRVVFKVLSLAVFYMMGKRSVAKKLKKFNYSDSESAGLLRTFKELYQTTFDYMQRFKDDAAAYGSVHTSMGWSRFFPDGAKINPRSIQNWSIQAESAEILRNAWIRLTGANIKVCAAVHDAFLIECPIPEVEDHIRIAKRCMVDAARHIVGGTIQVEHETHYGNFKQDAKDQEIFDLIFDEINKYKKIEKYKQGQDVSQKMVRGISVVC